MRRLAALASLATILVPLWSVPSASACTCEARAGREGARNAVAVFVGLAEETTPVPGAPTAVLTSFSVESGYKGGLAPGAEVAIVHEARAPACGMRFDSGARYTVFAGEFHWRLIASSCSPTAAGVISARALGLRPPDAAAASPSPSGSARVGLARVAAALVWGTGIALVTVLALRGRRRRSAYGPVGSRRTRPTPRS